MERGGRRFLAPLSSLLSSEKALSHYLNPTYLNQTANHKSTLPAFEITFDSPLRVTLPSEESHHAFSVLRLKENESVSVFDPESQIEGLGSLTKESHEGVVLVHLLKRTNQNFPILIIGTPKPKTAEEIIEKSTEIGVQEIHFVQSDYSNTKSTHINNDSSRRSRIFKIRDAAVKQSYSSWAPKIIFHESLDLCLSNTFQEEVINSSNSKRFLCEPPHRSLKEPSLSLKQLSEVPSSSKGKENDQPTHLAIGPEGGFSEREKAIFLKYNFYSLSLGENVLRVETATLISLGICSFINPLQYPSSREVSS